jgi:hypothetical protein
MKYHLEIWGRVGTEICAAECNFDSDEKYEDLIDSEYLNILSRDTLLNKIDKNATRVLIYDVHLAEYETEVPK